MWESARVRESPRPVGIRERARVSESRARGRRRQCAVGTPRPKHERAKWNDSWSATRRCAGFSVKPAATKRDARAATQPVAVESPGKWPRSFARPRASGPGAGELAFGRVRFRPRRSDSRDVRPVRRDARDAGGRWARQAASGCARRLDNARSRRAVPVRRDPYSSEAGLRRLNGPSFVRPRASRQGASAGGEGRGRGSGQALWGQHPEREALPRAARGRCAAGRSCHEKDSRIRRARARLGRRSRKLHVPSHPQAGATCRTSWPQADAGRRGRHQDRGRARHHPEGDGQ